MHLVRIPILLPKLDEDLAILIRDEAVVENINNIGWHHEIMVDYE